MRQRSEFERIRSVLEQAEVDDPLTAREIVEVLEDYDVEIDSPHRVATVLGRYADYGDVDVIHDQPYRYEV